MPLIVDSLPPDARGEIHKLDLNGVKVNLLFSKGGSLRGGDVHPVDQHGFIIEGAVWVTTTFKIARFETGQYFRVPAGVPHLYEYVLPTTQLEWWSGPFEAEYYRPFRNRVEESLREGEGPANEPKR